jgi:pimeloyl-ACP methyl ester carboxylesterase
MSAPAFVQANGLQFASIASGPSDGPLALCLHGFPDSAYTWRYLMPALADAGYHAVAVWQRGYAPTAIPSDAKYDAFVRGADVNALHAALGGDARAVLIGHDYGASSAYAAAAAMPDNWAKIVTLAVPPPASMATKRTIYEQMKRSWYTYFFQRPNAPDVVAADDFALIGKLWRDWSPGYDPSDDLSHVKAALAGDHCTAAVGYYLAMFGPTPLEPPPQPALYLHGVDDGCLGIALMDDVLDYLPNPASRFECVDGTGHFLHLEAPHDVNARIMAFLRA